MEGCPKTKPRSFNSRMKLAFALAAIVTMLLLFDRGSSVIVRERKQLGRFSPTQARRVTNSIANLIRQLANFQLYSAGRSFSYTFMVTEKIKATVRLWFFSIAYTKMYTSCSISPNPSMVLRYETMQHEYWRIFQTVFVESQAHGYGCMIVVHSLFAIDYVSWFGQQDYDNSELDNAFSYTSINSSFNHEENAFDADHEDCWPFTTSMISGYQTVGSYAFAPYIFWSKNERFRAFLQSDCNFVLYDWFDNRRVIWSSNTLETNVRALCSISLQVDSNMLINDNYRIVRHLFTSDRYCTPQPNCVRTAGLSVEDNGYIVIWDTDTQTELWRVPSNSTTSKPPKLDYVPEDRSTFMLPGSSFLPSYTACL